MYFRDRALSELPQAERDLQEAKEKLERLRGLMAEGKLVGSHTKLLLQTMKHTYKLQVRHVETLKQEIESFLAFFSYGAHSGLKLRHALLV